MKRYMDGISRDQGTLFPDHLDGWIDDENVVGVIDAFVDELDLDDLGFKPAEATGRPGYHPSLLLKLYIYGYLNRVQSSRRLEREALCNVEMMWLLGRLVPDRLLRRVLVERSMHDGQGTPDRSLGARRCLGSGSTAAR